MKKQLDFFFWNEDKEGNETETQLITIEHEEGTSFYLHPEFDELEQTYEYWTWYEHED